MEDTWEGEISKTGKLPEMKTFHPLDRTEMCHPPCPARNRCLALLSAYGRECVISGSSMRLEV